MYLELLKLAAPEMLLVVAALAVLAADSLALRGLDGRFRRVITAMVGCVGCIAAAAWMLALPQESNFQDGMLVVEPLTQLVKTGLLALTVFTLLLSIESDFTTHVGEFVALVLLATVGMMFLVSSQDILMIFLSLELTSLSLYILAAFNKRSVQSAEAALKYFLFGGLSAAFTLFGLSLLYGLSGSTNLVKIADAIFGRGLDRLDPVLIVALVMTVIGFGFKIAAAPFHLWAPDAYQGAPAPSAALIASGSKLASFFIFARVMALGFHGAEGVESWTQFKPGWIPLLAIVAALSMVLGNLAALAQSSVRRLLAYSAIAHAGYMLLAIMANGGTGLAALVFYSVTYGLTTIGAFGVVAFVENQTGGERLSDFAGLSRRSPLVAFCMLIFMLSLAGIPPLAGFFGKFYVFSAAVGSGSNLDLLWLVVLAIALSAVSLYYYLQVLKQIYVVEAAATSQATSPQVISQVVLAVLAVGVIAFGCMPDLLVGRLVAVVKLAGL